MFDTKNINTYKANLIKLPAVMSWERKKYPTKPTGKTKTKDSAKKSKTLPIGNFFFLPKRNNAKIPPIIPPVKESPGKYGKSKKPNGFINTLLGFANTKNALEKKSEIREAINATLKMSSSVIFFLVKT